MAGAPAAARVAADRAGGARKSRRRGVPRLGDAGGRQDHLRPPHRPPDAERRVRLRASSSPPRPPTSAASGRPTRPATGSTSSRTGRTPTGRSRPTSTASPSPTRRSPPGRRPHRNACAQRRATLLIADEPHHMGDRRRLGRCTTAWTPSTAPASGCCSRGTPFRSDNSAIPWVEYDDDGFSRADYAYGYPQALLDRVCRPITFLPYDGDMEWISDGRAAHVPTSTSSCRAASRRGACARRSTPEGDWMRRRAARRRRDACAEMRADGHPDAGGLVVASTRSTRGRSGGAARGDLRRAAGDRDVRRARRQSQRIAALRRLHAALDRLGADGLRGRRHPAPAGRRLRHARPHRAVLPPGRRPLHPPPRRRRAGR